MFACFVLLLLALMEWHSLSLDAAQKELGGDIQKGLDADEVLKRQKRYGPNELPRGKKLHAWRFFLRQFKNPLIFILLTAAAITYALNEIVDTSVILIAVAVNAGVGFFQEFRSNRTFEALRQMIRATARVRRNGAIHEIPARDLVPGDIILLKTGMKIPADARILSSADLDANEALLTGESTPIEKDPSAALPPNTPLADRANMIFAGAAVERGEATALVVETGEHTQIGQIAALATAVKEESTPLQERLAHLGRLIAYGVLVGALLILIFGVVQERPVVEMFALAVAVAVAAIPEGLPAALSVVLAVASQRIFKERGLVKNLIGAETLGSTTVICTDKTGTLTEGRMKIEALMRSRDENETARILALANEAEIVRDETNTAQVRGEGTDRAKMEFFLSTGGDKEALLQRLPRIAFLPFDDEKHCMASFHQGEGDIIHMYVTGEPEKIISWSSMTEQEKEEHLDFVKTQAKKGLRMIATAKRDIPIHAVPDLKSIDARRSLIRDLTFCGFAALGDPIRPDVKQSIKEVREAGIHVIMITGDHELTARSVGEELGFAIDNDAILNGARLDAMPDEKLEKMITGVNICARATPKHKLRIIDALKKRGAVVAMTGDGVNDAPALRAADIGIALGSGTDVTKEAADLILLDDSFSIITAAIRQGRIAFDNIRKVTVFLLSNSFTEFIIVLASLVLKMPLPITAVQILWANLVEDGFPNFALAFEPGDNAIMQRRPLKRKEPILDQEGVYLVFIFGIIRDLLLLGIFLMLYAWSDLPLVHIQTFMFVALGTDSLIYIFSIKSLRSSLWRTNLVDNWYLIFAVAFGGAIMIASVYTAPLANFLGTVPLRAKEISIIIGLAAVQIILIELTKYHFRRVRNPA